MNRVHKLLALVDELDKKATPGPWVTGYPNACKITSMPDHVWSINKDLIAKDLVSEDSSLIAASRTLLPAMAKALEEATITLSFYALPNGDDNEEAAACLKKISRIAAEALGKDGDRG